MVALAATSDVQLLWSLYMVAIAAISDVQVLWSMCVVAMASQVIYMDCSRCL